MTEEEMRIEQERQEAMEREYTKSSGGNYFNYVDTAKLEREGITQWKPTLGPNSIRIVYPPLRSGYFGMEIFKHSNVGVNRKAFICKRRMFDEPCPICEFADQLRKMDPSDSRIKELQPSRRYLFFVVDISSEEEEKKGRRWFDCPVTLFNEIKSRSKRRRRRGDTAEDEASFLKYINVSHPTDGRDIDFEQVKESGKYSYTGCELVEGPAVPESWYKDLPEFRDILKESDEEEMLDAVSDQFEEEVDEPKASEGRRRERTDMGSSRRSSREDKAEQPPEIEDDTPEEPAVETQEETPKAETRGETRGESRRETRGESKEEKPATSGEDDMKSRVQARLEAARKKRAGGE
jgi:hypothetical protein